jgi:hypothetical protein
MLRVAEVPWPSADPATPLPASVETDPVARLTTRMRWLERSATIRFASSLVMPLGPLKRADAAGPFRNPAVPLPAKVATEPAVVKRFIVWSDNEGKNRKVPSVVTAAASPTHSCAPPTRPTP